MIFQHDESAAIAPAANPLDQAGQTLRITASDDFEVTGVEVTITGANGQVIERGPAGFEPSIGRWVYTTSVAAPAGEQLIIEATAMDRPGVSGTPCAPRGPTFGSGSGSSRKKT